MSITSSLARSWRPEWDRDTCQWRVIAADGAHIATMGPGSGGTDPAANAQLVALAPRMLATLEDIEMRAFMASAGRQKAPHGYALVPLDVLEDARAVFHFARRMPT